MFAKNGINDLAMQIEGGNVMKRRMAPIVIDPPVIAHRGDSTLAPENTLAAFVQAKRSGANWIELDVMLAACGEVVVIHDETLDRTTNGKGRVRDFPYSTLATLDAGSWFDSAFSQEKIPTLREVLTLCEEIGLGLNIEIKAPEGLETETACRVLEVLSSHTLPATSYFLSSFSVKVLRAIRDHSASLTLGLLLDQWRDDWRAVVDSLGCWSILVNYRHFGPREFEVFKQAGLEVFAYTLNIPSEAIKQFFYGLDGIFSDCPAKMIVETKGLKASAHARDSIVLKGIS